MIFHLKSFTGNHYSCDYSMSEIVVAQLISYMVPTYKMLECLDPHVNNSEQANQPHTAR